ncbi:MAG: C25 family cysteine peptidase [Nitrospirae bacterium]|nr:C25 family cysteine peptidase [Nitrospirota bacterium]
MHYSQSLRETPRGLSISVLSRFLLVLMLLAGCATYTYAAAPAGYSEYYIPGDEDIMGTVLCAEGSTACPGGYHTHAVISVTVWTDNTTIYYDHWENGYNFDPADPSTADETYTMNTGQIHAFESANIALPTTARGTCSPAGTCPYDGRDRIYVAGGVVTVTRVGWIEERGVGLQGTAWEIYPVKPQLTTYVVPFGETSGWYGFQRVNVLIQATKDNTVVTVDLNHDGAPDQLDTDRDGTLDASSVTLQAGETFLLDDMSAHVAAGNLEAGAVITGTETLQVKYITGRTDINNCTRGFSAFPRGFWTKDYYAPLDQPLTDVNGQTSNTDYYLYNPNSAAIAVSWQGSAGSGSFNIPATSTVSFRTASGIGVPAGSGLYFNGSDIFWGVGSNDADRSGAGTEGYAHEWGYSLLPSTMMYTEHYLGWAPDGYDSARVGPPYYRAGDNEMGVFLTAAQDNTRVFVDYNNDGTADQTYTLDRLQTQFIADPDGDMSGARIWATGPFTMAYGQNSHNSDNSSPALDLGYIGIPGSDFISLVLSVDKSVSPQVVSTASGSQATFTIKVNSAKYTVDGVVVTDYLPAGWRFVNDSATITRPDQTQITGSAANPTITGSGPYTLEWSSAQTGGNMLQNQEITITFTGETTRTFSVGEVSENKVRAVGMRTLGGVTQTFTATDFVFNTFSDNTVGMQVAKSSSVPAATPINPGDTITYTVTVTNPASSTVPLTGVAIYDPLPAGVSYVAGSSQVTGTRATTQTDNVRDTFGSQAYSNNDGSANWAGDWIESDGTQSATGGNVQITNNELRLGSTSNIYRQVDLSGITAATLTLDYRTSDNVDNGEYAYVEVASSPGGPWTTVLSFQNDQSGSVNYSIPSSLRSATTSVRFRITGYDGNEYLYIDNVDITYTHTVSSSGTSAGGDAPNFVSASDGYSVAPGTTLTLTYDVTVDDPLATGIDEITNTAYGNSNEITFPLSASVTNIVVNPTSGSAQVGDKVWLDADGDGLQDVGEPGLANVEVTLKDRFGTPLMTTTTDSSGHYQFNGVEPGDGYYVEVTPGTLPTGLQQSAPSGRSDNRTDPFDISDLSPLGNDSDQFDTVAYDNSDGTVSWSANPWVETDNQGGGAGGGEIRITGGELRINNDTSGSQNSIQRPLSIPPGATMATLSFDWRTTGVETGDAIVVEVSLDGSTYTTLETFTNIAGVGGGHRSFDISSYLGAGAAIRFRVTAGYTASNDLFFVDNVNVEYSSASVLNNYLDADFGYRPIAGSAAIGGSVWSDANSNALSDPGEPGLGGVAVQLWLDSNSDGVLDQGTDTLVNSATTQPDGSYLFTGVSASGTEDYFLFVDETQTKLSGLTRTTPPDIYAFYLQNLSAGDVIMYAKFGYHNGSAFSIRDRVWFDANGNGSLDGGEAGISLVTADLLDSSLNTIASAITDAGGLFTFSGVTGGGADYTIRISDTGGKLANYFGTTANATAGTESIINLSGNIDYSAAPHFGYNLRRSIGTAVFNDINGNGVQDAGEFGFSGVTVKLYRDTNGNGVIDAGEPLVATLTTDADGNYLFTGLSDGNYVVSVESPPAGYTYNGTDSDPVTTGQQQAASITGGGNALTANFGYSASTPRSVSGTIWQDGNANGLVDGGEVGLAGVTVALLQGSAVIATTSSTTDGGYSFSNLAAALYTVRVTDNSGILSGYVGTYEKTEGTTGPFDGEEGVDLGRAVAYLPAYGYNIPIPTLVVISSFGAYERDGQVVVEWETTAEHNTLGFYLLRFDAATGEYQSLTSGLLPGLLTSPNGGIYSLIDRGASAGEEYRYKLVEVERNGSQISYGPFTVATLGKNAPGSAKLANGLAGATGRISLSLPSDYSRKPRERSLGRESGAQTVKAAGKSLLPPGAARKAPPSGSRIKIPIREGGIYYVDAGDIASLLGIPYSKVSLMIRQTLLSMSNGGRAVAYLPAQDNSGVFFYGTGTDSAYTRDNIYWIDASRGLSMNYERGPRPVPAEGYQAFTDTLHIEQDAIPNMQLNDPGADYWDWNLIFSSDFYSDGPEYFTFSSFGVANTGATATLRAHLLGGSDAGTSPDHHVIVSLNGQQIGEGRWGGLSSYTLEATFSQSLLSEGENTIEVQGVLDAGVPWSMFLIDSFDLSYERLYESKGNGLLLRGDGNPTVTVSGFTVETPEIFVFDIRDPLAPKLSSATVIDGSPGSYRVTFAPVSAGAPYLAVAGDAVVKVENGQAVTPADLQSRNLEADYLVIAPQELAPTAESLAAYRRAQGLKTMVVKLDDIMNEFNSGLSSPEAIRQFLSYAYYNWRKAPRYVLLAGGGTWDYRDNLGAGGNLIPAALVPTLYGLTTSDNYLADVNGDHLPEMAIGRLPALTAGELQNMINKIKLFESNPGSRVILLADVPDEGGDFTTDSEEIAALFPPDYVQEKVYLGVHSFSEARSMLSGYLNGGSAFFNYVGHGGLDVLSKAGILSNNSDYPDALQVDALTNASGLPVMVAMTCVAGEFAVPGYLSVSQSLVLKGDGGAVAVWSATGLSDDSEAKILNSGFYRAVFASGKKTLGDAVLEALSEYRARGSMPFMMDIYTILGDPALRIE